MVGPPLLAAEAEKARAPQRLKQLQVAAGVKVAKTRNFTLCHVIVGDRLERVAANAPALRTYTHAKMAITGVANLL